jgi:hypothetical protein
MRIQTLKEWYLGLDEGQAVNKLKFTLYVATYHVAGVVNSSSVLAYSKKAIYIWICLLSALNQHGSLIWIGLAYNCSGIL